MKIVSSLEESGWLIKGVSETIKNEVKKKQHNSKFVGTLLGILGSGLLRNIC